MSHQGGRGNAHDQNDGGPPKDALRVAMVHESAKDGVAKRLERGRFIWPNATEGSVHLSGAQLSMLLEGIDWRRPSRTWQPEKAG